MDLIPHSSMLSGDGDLSFSLAIKRAYPDLSVTASTLLNSPEELIRTYSNSSDIVRELLDQWKVTIAFGVDATQITEKFTSTDDRFDAVLFNHPHLGSATLLESEEKHAKRHHVLLAHYFHSAKQVLKPRGVVHVCLCGNQPKTWDVATAAHRNGFHCLLEKSSSCPMTWLFKDRPEYKLAEVEAHYRVKRKFRNGKLGSKHFLSRYGYMHRRTEGDLYRGNVREVNVQQSINLVYALHFLDGSTRGCRTDSCEANFQCSICNMTVDSKDELMHHLKYPALPDVHTSSVDIARSSSIERNSEIETEKPAPCKESSDRQDSQNIQIDVGSTTILDEVRVMKEFDKTRIKWLLRQPHFPLSKYIKSKKQCEDAIKQGRVFVNQNPAFDTGRIVHENDIVTLVEKHDFLNKDDKSVTSDLLQSGVKIIEQIGCKIDGVPSLVVVYKPVGIRCVGQFSPDTIEMITKSHLQKKLGITSLNCQSISKIDTGCAGLCALRIGRTSGASLPKALYIFTVLVHGSPNESWNSGVYVDVSNSGNRNWKRQKTVDDDSDRTFSFNTTQTTLDMSAALFIQCQDTYHVAQDDSSKSSISTVVIRSSYDDGRLANTISFTLRKLGYPVVNDRFAKRESSSLPRRMRNLLKQKVCIGCYKIELYDEEVKQKHTASIEPHNRTQCSYWRKILEASTTNEVIRK